MTTMQLAVNLLMLVGLGFLIFRLLWAIPWAATHALMKVVWGRPKSWLIAAVYGFWVYYLIAWLLALHQQIRLLAPVEHWINFVIAGFLLLVYLIADRIGQVVLAFKEMDKVLAGITHKQNIMALLFLIYGLWALVVRPDWAQVPGLTAWASQLQQLLRTPFWGLVWGFVGIFYMVLLVAQIMRFGSQGTNGMKPFPERLRK